MKNSALRSLTLKTTIILAFCAGYAAAEENADHNWHFSGSLLYSSRSLDGTIVDATGINDSLFGTLFATGDSMNVGTSDNFQLALAAQYKRFGVGLNYMPTSFSGIGSALVGVAGDELGVMVRTPLDTDVDIGMLLANVYYNIIQTPDTIFGVGLGFGMTSIDLNIVPNVGQPIIYDGQQPFGFLNVHFSSTYRRFLYGFALNGISADFGGVNIDYSDYKVNFGYRVIDKSLKFDIVGGFRQVNFAIDLDGTASEVAADVTLEGPFLGVSVTY